MIFGKDSRSLVSLALVLAAGCQAAYGDELGHPARAGQPQLAPEQPRGDGEQSRPAPHKLAVDIVADCKRFTSGGIGHPNANPKFGDYFMQEGLMLKGGTLAKNCQNGNGCGLNPDGSAQFPEAVIGKWTCYGSFVGNGAATAQGTWVYTTQVYEFDAEKLEPNVFAPGKSSIVSHGPERNDLNVPWVRAISGGTGQYRSAQGEVVQTKIGFNPTECENFTVDFNLDRGAR
jgi:hypothetical protein